MTYNKTYELGFASLTAYDTKVYYCSEGKEEDSLLTLCFLSFIDK